MTITALASGPSLEELYATTFHELRAPISSINGYASILLTGEMGKMSSRQRETLERIQELCRSLTNLIGNLLLLAKSGGGRAYSSRQFVDLTQLTKEGVRSLEGEIGRKKLNLSVRLPARPLRFWADPNELSEILLNLLSNAVKFTFPHGKVSVAISAVAGKAVIEVADTGVGIPPEELPRIFQEFYHVDHSETGSGPGSGLGLAIVKRIVDSYEGQIQVSSRLKSGSQFRVTLPIRSEDQILREFLEDAWVRAREADQVVGLVLLGFKPTGSSVIRWRASLEEILRQNLRKEDRVFNLPDQSLLGVLVQVKPQGFSVLVQRLEQVLQEDSVRLGLKNLKELPWRMVAVISPRRGGSPSRILQSAQARLHQVLKKGPKRK